MSMAIFCVASVIMTMNISLSMWSNFWWNSPAPNSDFAVWTTPFWTVWKPRARQQQPRLLNHHHSQHNHPLTPAQGLTHLHQSLQDSHPVSLQEQEPQLQHHDQLDEPNQVCQSPGWLQPHPALPWTAAQLLQWVLAEEQPPLPQGQPPLPAPPTSTWWEAGMTVLRLRMRNFTSTWKSCRTCSPTMTGRSLPLSCSSAMGLWSKL